MANGGSKMMTYVFAGIAAILMIILIAFAWQGNKIPIMKSFIERQWSEQLKEIQDKHNLEMANKESAIREYEENIQNLSKKYTSLVSKIKDKSKQKADIKPPKDEQAIKDRLDKLGYKVVVK